LGQCYYCSLSESKESCCSCAPHHAGAEEEEEAFWADYVTGWADNADLAATWGVNDEFMAQFEAGFEVRPGNNCNNGGLAKAIQSSNLSGAFKMMD
jgi:hypothetical protein